MHVFPALIKVFCVLTFLVSACQTPRPAVPGHTPYGVSDVVFDGATVAVGDLPVKLGMRAGNVLIPSQNYNVYRAEEDKRRVLAYWKTRGFLDATVEGPLLKKDEEEQTVAITWKVSEGKRYRVGSVKVNGAPTDLKERVEALIPFQAGDRIDDVQAWRLLRITMSELMRANGYAHAETFSRLFIHRKKHAIHWIYYVDPGPRTKVGKITIHGAKKIPEALIRRRLGLKTGEAYDHTVRSKAQLDLMDLGSFNVVRIKDDVDNEFLIGDLPPDRGGSFRPGHVDADGQIVPRNLSPSVDLQVHVQEAPTHKGRLGVGASADIGRFDSHVSLASEFRDLFGPTHHLLLDGRVAYGLLFDGETDDPIGLYGNGTIRYDSPGFLHHHLDLRVYGTWSERLFDGFHSRGLRTGLGFRSAIAKSTFLDVDIAYRLEWPVGLPDFDKTASEALQFDGSQLSVPELKLALVLDRRDNPIEALDGYFLGFDASISPGGGSHSYLTLGARMRYFLPLGNSMALGVRTQGSWVFNLGTEGLPPAVRLFGGGSFGMRGYGRQALTSVLEDCPTQDCRSWGVGALSLVEATFDFRWLPFRKQFGANAFVDLGAASATANPFEDGISLAVGLGARVRLWYIPLSLDVSYRPLGPDALSHLDSWLFFARIGESF
jgi:outer membrane protein assembly factor BamA